MLLSDIPGPSLWLLKRTFVYRGEGDAAATAQVSGRVLDPSDTQIVFAEWAGEGREREMRSRKRKKMC